MTGPRRTEARMTGARRTGGARVSRPGPARLMGLSAPSLSGARATGPWRTVRPAPCEPSLSSAPDAGAASRPHGVPRGPVWLVRSECRGLTRPPRRAARSRTTGSGRTSRGPARRFIPPAAVPHGRFTAPRAAPRAPSVPCRPGLSRVTARRSRAVPGAPRPADRHRPAPDPRRHGDGPSRTGVRRGRRRVGAGPRAPGGGSQLGTCIWHLQGGSGHVRGRSGGIHIAFTHRGAHHAEVPS